MKNNHKVKLNEGLRRGDLDKYVSETFSIDRYSSKMGEDSDIVVLGFTVKDKMPATDLMEFIETGYPFVLDADMSTGEEFGGFYQVFAEIERTDKIGEQIEDLLNGVGQLCNINDWKFTYQKSTKNYDFTVENITEQVPLNRQDYETKILEEKNQDLKDFFDQGMVELNLDQDNTLTFSKPYSGLLETKFVKIGSYENVSKTLPGKLSLDESSQSQCFFLTKYLGNYEIHKIGEHFLIGNGDKAIVIKKERW